jgi:hypothetical protein
MSSSGQLAHEEPTGGGGRLSKSGRSVSRLVLPGCFPERHLWRRTPQCVSGESQKAIKSEAHAVWLPRVAPLLCKMAQFV